MYTPRHCCYIGVYLVSAPSRDGTKILEACCPSVSAIAQPIPSAVTDTSNSDGSHAWEMPRALICLTSIFAFLKEACCSDPQSHSALSLSGGVRNGGTVSGEE